MVFEKVGVSGYGNRPFTSLWRTGSRGMPVQFCVSLSGDGKQLKRRLNLMLNVKKLKKHTALGLVTVAFLHTALQFNTSQNNSVFSKK
jgi:hypothetical protein